MHILLHILLLCGHRPLILWLLRLSHDYGAISISLGCSFPWFCRFETKRLSLVHVCVSICKIVRDFYRSTVNYWLLLPVHTRAYLSVSATKFSGCARENIQLIKYASTRDTFTSRIHNFCCCAYVYACALLVSFAIWSFFTFFWLYYYWMRVCSVLLPYNRYI